MTIMENLIEKRIRPGLGPGLRCHKYAVAVRKENEVGTGT
jgi:hypothetical protein